MNAEKFISQKHGNGHVGCRNETRFELINVGAAAAAAIFSRNMFFTINKKEAAQLIPYEAVQNIIRTQENTERLDALERIELKIKSEMQTWEEYDRQLFILYRNSGFSMRKIEAEVGIGLRSVWQTINNCKKRLNEAIGEDWQDYINEDFELI